MLKNAKSFILTGIDRVPQYCSAYSMQACTQVCESDPFPLVFAFPADSDVEGVCARI